MTYDIVIIGAGPGGYVAAIRARQHGANVALIEKEQVGGTCLNRGCIPSKALIASAQRLDHVRHAARLGISGVHADVLGIDAAAVIKRKDTVVATLRGGVEHLLKGNGVELIRGTAKIEGPGCVSVDSHGFTRGNLPNEHGECEGGAQQALPVGGATRAPVTNARTLEAKNIIIATGSTWKSLPNIPIDGEKIVASDHMFHWDRVPQRLGIIGGGIIGCEFASMMQIFGSQVTVIEATATLLPGEDPIVGRTLARLLGKRGTEILTETTVVEVSTSAGHVSIKLSNGESRDLDNLLVAVGRKPFTEGLGARELGLVNDNGFITVDDRMATSVPGIYAIGDVAGKLMLAHVASAEADVAATNALGGNARMSYHAVPRPIYTIPEACCVGATEESLEKDGVAYKIGRFAYAAVSKALCDGETEGSIAVYANGKDVLLGGYIIGPHATDLAQNLCIAVQNRLTTDQFASTIHSHPTYSELVKEAVEDVEGKAVHKVTVRKNA